MDDRRRLGRRGEARAARWYRARGYRVLDRNWRVKAGELDLVVSRGDVVVFCEVKTRTTPAFGRGVEAVGLDKQRRIRGLAVQWLRTASRRFDHLRFDVADVDGHGHIEVFEDCF